jgi:lysophospholipase L1-like esterase
MKRTLTTIAVRLMVLATPLLLLLVVAEVAVRLIVPAERWRHVDANDNWQVDPTVGWVQPPHLDSFSRDSRTSEPIPLRTNADGLLPPTATRERPPGRMRILLVGDSTIVGAGVHEQERIHNALTRELGRQGLQVDVVNAGVEGYSTDQALLRLEQLIEPYAPDLVLHCVCSNDFAANSVDSNYGVNKPSFRVAPSGELAANPFEPSAKIARRGSGLAAIIQRSAVYRMLQPRLVVLRAKLGGWQERNLIGMADDWYYDPAALEKIDWPLFGGIVERMRDVAADHGAGFAVYAHPEASETWDPVIDDTLARAGIGEAEYDRFALERRMGEELARREVVLLPMIDYFVDKQERGPFHLLPRDPHCNAEGYRMQAERLAERIASGELFSRWLPDGGGSAPRVPPAPPAAR